jgi:flagellar biosynthesis chaperone FliJ
MTKRKKIQNLLTLIRKQNRKAPAAIKKPKRAVEKIDRKLVKPSKIALTILPMMTVGLLWVSWEI